MYAVSTSSASATSFMPLNNGACLLHTPYSGIAQCDIARGGFIVRVQGIKQLTSVEVGIQFGVQFQALGSEENCAGFESVLQGSSNPGGEGFGVRQLSQEFGGMGHGIAVSPEVAKRVLWSCLAMPVAALGVRLYQDPSHQAHTHHEAQLPMPPHVPPPVADFSEQQQSADSS